MLVGNARNATALPYFIVSLFSCALRSKWFVKCLLKLFTGEPSYLEYSLL